MFVQTKVLQNISIAKDTEGTDTDPESNGGTPAGNRNDICPPAESTPGGGDRSSVGATSADRPVPKPRASKPSVRIIAPEVSPPGPSSTSPSVVASSPHTSPQPSPAQTALTPSKSDSEPHESTVKGPAPRSIPVPPPLPFKANTNSRKPHTKAFHWDVVSTEKVTLALKVKTSFICRFLMIILFS